MDTAHHRQPQVAVAIELLRLFADVGDVDRVDDDLIVGAQDVSVTSRSIDRSLQGSRGGRRERPGAAEHGGVEETNFLQHGFLSMAFREIGKSLGSQ